MILMYHKVDLWSPTMWWVDVAVFYRQMCCLAGKKVVYLDDYDPGNESHVVITFDGVYSNVVEYAAPILSEFGYPYELFITSDWVGLSNEFDAVEPATRFAGREELRRLVSSGGRLQWHTRSHQAMNRRCADADWQDLERELEIPEDIAEIDLSGFGWFAYPYGEFSEDVVELVKSSGFRGALSCHQGNDSDIFKLNRVTVLNSPLPESPTICAIVVSYNYGAFLSEAIESILLQTLLPDSILIVDDASTDNTYEVGKKYADLYPDLIRIVSNKNNIGIVGTFNMAVAMADSDYVFLLGADNRVSVNYVEAGLRSLLSTGSDIAYSDFRLFGDRAREEYFNHPLDRQGRIFDGQYYEVVFPDFSLVEFLKGNFIHGSSIYSKRAFEAVGGYKERRSGRPEDASLFKRMLVAGYKATKVRHGWLEYRQHSISQANMVSKLQADVEFLRIYSKRLEFKVKSLEIGFGVFSPVVRLLSALERRTFMLIVKGARLLRRTSR